MTLASTVSGFTQLEVPLPAFNFFVTLDPTDAYLPAAQAALIPTMAAGAFAEVKGLSSDLEVMAYPEGGVNDYLHQLPVRHSWGRITLRRGVIRDLALWLWYRAGLFGSQGARRDGAIILCDESGGPAIAWAFRGGLAAKWTGPDLSASQSNAAIDGLEIAHEGLEAVPIPPASAASARRIRDV